MRIKTKFYKVVINKIYIFIVINIKEFPSHIPKHKKNNVNCHGDMKFPGRIYWKKVTNNHPWDESILAKFNQD